MRSQNSHKRFAYIRIWAKSTSLVLVLFLAVLLATPLFAANDPANDYDPARDPNQLWGSQSPFADYQSVETGAPYLEYGPELILSQYSVTENALIAGGDVTMEFTFVNTSRITGVFDLVITFGTSVTTLYPAYGQTNQSYLTAIPPGGEATVERSFVIANTSADIIEMPIRIRYQGVGTGQKENNIQVYFPIFSANSLSTQINIESTVYTGAEIMLNGFCGNASRRAIVDLEMLIDGDIIGSPKLLRLGNLSPGEQIPINSTITFPDANSAAVVSVSFSFSDLDGNRIEMAAQNYRVMVIDRPESTLEHTEGGLSTSELAVGGVGILGVLLVLGAIIRKAWYRRTNR